MSLSAPEVQAFITAGLPAFADSGIQVESCDDDSATLRLRYDASQLRPGGSLSGPTLMALADTAMYALILGRLGPVAMAVTQNLNINFLRRPAPADLLAEARFLRLGRRAAVIEVLLRSAGDEELAAHVTGTYALPSGSDKLPA